VKRIFTCLAVLSPLIVVAQAVAWGPAGHKIVAAIAFRQLTPAQQATIVAILKQHPRFQEDFEDKMPEGVEANEWIFQQAAVWPDIARDLPYEAKKEFSRPNWHFIDLPYFPTDEDRAELAGKLKANVSFELSASANEKMNAVQAYRFALHVLEDPHASASDKAKYLSWIIHLVGDTHQPLHCATLCTVDLFPEGDHGGNSITTVEHKELHALWDGFPGSPSMKFNAVQKKAMSLTHEHELEVAGRKAAADLNIETWVKESHDYAERFAYTQQVLEHLEGQTDAKRLAPMELSEEYLSDGGNLAKQRLVEAGYRLGAVLKRIAGDGSIANKGDQDRY
jgi:hypothetical protein